MIPAVRAVPSGELERAVICQEAHGPGQRLAYADSDGLWLWCKACRRAHCYHWSALLRLFGLLAPGEARELLER